MVFLGNYNFLKGSKCFGGYNIFFRVENTLLAVTVKQMFFGEWPLSWELGISDLYVLEYSRGKQMFLERCFGDDRWFVCRMVFFLNIK